MMENVVYAIRTDRSNNKTIIEVNAKEYKAFFKAEDKRGAYKYSLCTAEYARDWVKKGWTHETALWVDGDHVRRAKGGWCPF
jgi:hypothetical protein